MIGIVLATVFCILHASLSIARAEEARLVVRLAEPPSGGSIKVLIFDSANAFKDFSDPLLTRSFTADGKIRELELEGIAAGRYAVLVFLDENGNDRLDFNFIGIPKEPIGFANSYRPRGAPNFERASIRLAGSLTLLDISLERPLGKRGRIALGAGVIARSSPYAQSRGNPVVFIPAVTYIGERLQIYGPFAQFGLAGSGRLRLAASIAYRMGFYESGDSPVLAGMADRQSTAMAGLRLLFDAPGGIAINAGYAHDVLDRIGGNEAQLGMARSISWRTSRLTPSLTLNWSSARMVRHDYGISTAEATDERAAYRPGDAFSIEAGIGVFTEITHSIYSGINLGLEWLDKDVRNSPIVDSRHVLKGFAFISYML